MSAQSITLARGETLELSIEAVNDGVTVALDGTWSVASTMVAKNHCADSETYNLSPVISGGVATVSYDTKDLTDASYVFDIRFTEAATNELFSSMIYLYLTDTITPAV